ncbi:cyclic-phosphate processing receiver domain-containing protein [Paenibacillus filicis]|uniref:Cyclic-phosphate processing receiver domain-containing protein n=1 Tax=Paenibacillus filicis TaxID=669464 RepID=A0ABU9DIC0_9BACL
MTKIDLYLDDLRPCPPGFALARSAEECLLMVKECRIGILSLDYDLGWGAPNGMDVVRGLIASGTFPDRIYLHTSSESGRRQMYEALYQSKPDRTELYAGPMPYEMLAERAAQAGKPSKKAKE